MPPFSSSSVRTRAYQRLQFGHDDAQVLFLFGERLPQLRCIAFNLNEKHTTYNQLVQMRKGTFAECPLA